jgi:ABC-2 type transport system permease protein
MWREARMRFFLALLRTSIRASISVRGAFVLESVLMIVNNLVFVLMWWIFFRQFKEIGGWTMKDMIALNAIGMGAYGLMQICFGNVKQLSRIILSGDLDPFMTQPKNLLIHLISSKSFAKGWGFLMTAAILVAIGRFTTIFELALILLSIVSGCLVFTSIAIIAHSMVFWLGSVESVSRKYCDSLFMFALYPTNIYSGLLQFVMFTLIPAGIIGYLPVELLRNFTWPDLAILVASSGGFFILAFVIFHLGLKRYESGNQFGMRL